MMWKKNPYIKIEFPPGKKQPEVTVHLTKDTNPYAIARCVNDLILRENLDDLLDIIAAVGDKKGLSDLAEEIIETIVEVQQGVQIRPRPRHGRNPIIKPSRVMEQFSESDPHE